MKTHCIFALGAILALGGIAGGCKPAHDKDDGHDHAVGEAPAHDHDSENLNAEVDPKKGLRLPAESRESLGLKIGTVEEKEISEVSNVTAQVYRAATEPASRPGTERFGYAYAMAFVPGDGSSYRPPKSVSVRTKDSTDSQASGTVWKVDSSSSAVLGKSEIILELPDSEHRWKVGDFVSVEISQQGLLQKRPSVPTTAILRTSEGVYVFIDNDGYLQRQSVQVGKQSEGFVEIVNGLSLGERIAVSSVETIHLIELRATKGGGHSH